jgi:hypothetical protein
VWVEVAGTHTPARPGLNRSEVVGRTIAKAAVVASERPGERFVVLTSGAVRGGPMAAVTGPDRPVHAVVDVTADDAVDRLTAALASG